MVIPDYIGQDGLRRSVRHANEFWDSYGVTVHEERRQQGDLIFFSRNGHFPTHIGIVRDEESYIHAPGSADTKVEIKPIEFEPTPMETAEGAIYIRNPIGFKSPSKAIEQPTYRYHQALIE